MTELEKYITSYFGSLTSEELSQLTVLFKPMRLKKGDYLLESGKLSDKLCFVQSGIMRMFTIEEKKEVTQWISTKGYFTVDLQSFIFDKTSRWTIQALEDTELFGISKADYQKINQLVPKWPELEKQFIVNCFTSLENRIYGHLSLSAEERYLAFFQNNKELFNQVPLQYIASMLGMTPETFSRIRKKTII
jgi:CRP/FNR family transcriptional regulator, anaerobic regulatory protein